MQFQLLIVDDDKEIIEVLSKLLTIEGYIVFAAYNGLEALRIINENDIHLVLMDVMMPQLNGISALLKMREKHNIPIIMLSAKTEESDKVAGLTMGADDYIEKPFQTAELIARVSAQLRRYFRLGAVPIAKEDTIALNDLVLHKKSKMLLVREEEVKLTPTEYKILELLMEHAGQVFSAEQIYEAVWQEEAYAAENAVMVHIRRIREKIELDTKRPQYLKVVWGIGYKIIKEG